MGGALQRGVVVGKIGFVGRVGNVDYRTGGYVRRRTSGDYGTNRVAINGAGTAAAARAGYRAFGYDDGYGYGWARATQRGPNHFLGCVFLAIRRT